MAASESDDSDFGNLIDQAVREKDQGFASDDQSDISVSSGNTAYLSDYNNESDIELSPVSSDDDTVQPNANWSDDSRSLLNQLSIFYNYFQNY